MTADELRKEQVDFLRGVREFTSVEEMSALALQVMTSMAIEIAAQLAEHNERENKWAK